MPTWTELQTRIPNARNPKVRIVGDEVLVADDRARMTPGNFVEEKLRQALAVEQPRRSKPKPK
jgi:hypothetical protein